MRIKHLRKKDNGIVKLGIVKYSMVDLFVEVFSACLLECSIEDFNAELVGDHVALNCEQDELGEVHAASLLKIDRK